MSMVLHTFLCYFYPRPPRGGRRFYLWVEMQRGYFYPRPPRGGRHATQDAAPGCIRNFYPRPPRGGRLNYGGCETLLGAFLSTPSARRATCVNGFAHILVLFLSTPSARRATNSRKSVSQLRSISIHALREEGDLQLPVLRLSDSNFYPRPPRGGRPGGSFACLKQCRISIHALREEGDAPVSWMS